MNDNINFEDKLNSYIAEIEHGLKGALPNVIDEAEPLKAAMTYSLLAGGKRIRPVLAMAFCEMCGESHEKALYAAMAVEYIHTYSLIHDDLPCMDNDDMRRGRPTCHIAFGEATALLAGDGLLTEAFSLAAKSVALGVSAENTVKILSLLSSYAGITGMIGGQVADISFENGNPTAAQLEQMYLLKTSALIQLACEIGCISADADEEKVKLAHEFGGKLGLAFQLIDDILDIEGDAAILGKSTGSDEKKHKPTLAVVLGLDEAKERSAQLTNEALAILNKFENNAFLKALTKSLLNRQK